jgi:putative ABC transport system ATP-binding protein
MVSHMDPLLLTHVHKTYRLDRVDVPALCDINLNVRPQCFTVLSGTSGSGKTTLLNLIGCIDRPDRGDITVAGQRVADLDNDALSDFRLRHIGFIFQNFNLLPVLTAYENVEYPLLLIRTSAAARRKRVQELLSAVGLSRHAEHWPGQLSGGQRQRVAIARALATAPELILADEPTANLDSQTGEAIIALMRTMQREYSATFVFSSHDPKVLEAADDAVLLKDGRIVTAERHSGAQRLPS